MALLQCASVCLCCRRAQEIDALLDLDHPNVVGLNEYFVQNNRVRGGQWPCLGQGSFLSAEGEPNVDHIPRPLPARIQYRHRLRPCVPPF